MRLFRETEHYSFRCFFFPSPATSYGLNQLAIDCQFKCKEHFASMTIDQWLQVQLTNASKAQARYQAIVVILLCCLPLDSILFVAVVFFYDATFSLYDYDRVHLKFNENPIKRKIKIVHETSVGGGGRDTLLFANSGLIFGGWFQFWFSMKTYYRHISWNDIKLLLVIWIRYGIESIHSNDFGKIFE